MSLKKTYEGLEVSIYTAEVEYLGRSVIKRHDTDRQHIVIDRVPESIQVGELYVVLIQGKNLMWEYSSRVAKDGTGFVFMLFKGREKEDRRQTRYPVSTTAYIDELFVDGNFYELMTNLPTQVVNMSREGIRIRAPKNTLLIGSKFSIKMKLGDKERLFEAVVANMQNKDGDEEYGCHLVWKADAGDNS